MAEPVGQFKPAVQHKRCGPSPSRMQITEPLSGKAGRSLEPQTEALIGLASQAERLFNFVEFGSLMQIMGRQLVKVVPSLRPLTAETAGSLNRVGPGTHYSV